MATFARISESASHLINFNSRDSVRWHARFDTSMTDVFSLPTSLLEIFSVIQISVIMCDFSDAPLLPLETDMAIVDDHGFTTQLDIGLLEAVMYEVVKGESVKSIISNSRLPPTAERTGRNGSTCLPGTLQRTFGSTGSSRAAGPVDSAVLTVLLLYVGILQALPNFRKTGRRW